MHKCELHKIKTEYPYIHEGNPDRVVERTDESSKSKKDPEVATTRAKTVAVVITSSDPLLKVQVITKYEDRYPEKTSIIERRHDIANEKYQYYLSVQEKSTPNAEECTWSSDDEWDPKKMPNMEI